MLELVDRQVVAGQVQQRVMQHRAVAVRQHEAVAVGPVRIGRVVPQVIAPQHLGDVGHAHRHAGMAGIGLLHGVHRQRADRVGKVFKYRRVEISKCSHEHELPCSTDMAHKNTAP